MPDKLTKTDEEWRNQLSPEQYQVTRHAGTEPAFMGKYWKTKDPGTYTCVCCGQPLFSSETKFDSGTGWPSFSEPADKSAVVTETDQSYGMTRTEVRCARCCRCRFRLLGRFGFSRLHLSLRLRLLTFLLRRAHFDAALQHSAIFNADALRDHVSCQRSFAANIHTIAALQVPLHLAHDH